jgi:hypothetical protein
MTEPVQIALTVATAPTILAIGTLIVGIRNSNKADEIHILVNSNLTSVKADLTLALDRVKKLEDMLLMMASANKEVQKGILEK